MSLIGPGRSLSLSTQEQVLVASEPEPATVVSREVVRPVELDRKAGGFETVAEIEPVEPDVVLLTEQRQPLAGIRDHGVLVGWLVQP